MKKALAEDPNAFDYDGVYEEMKGNQARPIHEDRAKREVDAPIFGLSIIWVSFTQMSAMFWNSIVVLIDFVTCGESRRIIRVYVTRALVDLIVHRFGEILGIQLWY